MNSLSDVQRALYQALMNESCEILSLFSSTHSVDRLGIYQSTIRENLKNALSSTYPGVWALLGDACADSVAYAFLKEESHLPVSACLDDWGDAFPNFLSGISELSKVPYLKDYAQFEWGMHLARLSPIVQSICIDVLKTLSEASLYQLKFEFIPSLSLYQFDYPVLDIQRVIENPNSETLNLKLHNNYVMVFKTDKAPVYGSLSAEYGAFISYLKNGLSLVRAIEETSKVYPDFDIINAVQYILNKNIIANFGLSS